MNTGTVLVAIEHTRINNNSITFSTAITHNSAKKMSSPFHPLFFLKHVLVARDK